MAAKKWQDEIFFGNWDGYSRDAPRIKNFIEIVATPAGVKKFVEIVPSHAVFETEAFLAFCDFCEKFKMAAIFGKTKFWEKIPMATPDTLWITNFIEITI